MSEQASTAAVAAAQAYYDSDDADRFYARIWGGEDIHIGLYESPSDPIAAASRRTVAHIASRAAGLDASTRVLDLGSGYGGAARYLALTHGCRVTGLNLSAVENRRARELNGRHGVAQLVEIVDGNFEQIPFDDQSFDLVWSQDAILHSGDRPRVVAEIARVLAPGGELLFTDPMQADGCPAGVLQPILDRIHLATLGSPGFYRREAARRGLEELGFEDLTEQLVRHYRRVLEETEERAATELRDVAMDYIARMRTGLGHWIEGGEKGYLAWGIFHFRKP